MKGKSEITLHCCGEVFSNPILRYVFSKKILIFRRNLSNKVQPSQPQSYVSYEKSPNSYRDCFHHSSKVYQAN